MDNCPLTGKPCPHKKCIHVTEVNPDYTANNCKDMCIICGIPYTNDVDPADIPTEVTDVFSLINNLIKEKEGIKTNIKTCSLCGFTMNDIANTSRVGCAECYTCFRKELEPFILSFHQAGKHLGKSPKSFIKPIKEEDIGVLKKEMEAAIKVENYELAAILRDKIKKLE